MKSRAKFKCFGLSIFILVPLKGFNQIPTNDEHWDLNQTLSDEFAIPSDYNLKWDNSYVWGCQYDANGDCYRTHQDYDASHPRNTYNFIYRDDELIYDNGILKIRSREDPQNFVDHSTGYCRSLNTGGFGYYEIRTKLGDSYNHRASFWLVGDRWENGNKITAFEIDIFEIWCELMYNEYNNGNPDYRTFTTHFIVDGVPNGAVHHTIDNTDEGLNKAFHTFGCELLPGVINYYHNDRLIHSVFSDELEGDIRLGIRSGQSVVYYPANTINLLPDTLEIDYIRYYELGMNNCTSDLSFSNSTQLRSYDHSSVRQNISIGNSSSNISLVSGSNISLRHSGEVEINGTFYLPIGSEFKLIPTNCP